MSLYHGCLTCRQNFFSRRLGRSCWKPTEAVILVLISSVEPANYSEVDVEPPEKGVRETLNISKTLIK